MKAGLTTGTKPKGAVTWLDADNPTNARKTVETISTSAIILGLLIGEQNWDVTDVVQFTTQCAQAVALIVDGRYAEAKVILTTIANGLTEV